jgi:calcineurin-like phosphoesterase
MTGPHDSVIGSVPDLALDRFLRQIPVRLEPANIEIDESTGRATAIQRLNLPFVL